MRVSVLIQRFCALLSRPIVHLGWHLLSPTIHRQLALLCSTE